MPNLFRYSAKLLFICLMCFGSAAKPLPAGVPHIAYADTTLPDDVYLVWNEAHNQRDSAALVSLFYQTVKYYGVRMSREKLVNTKMNFLRRNANYRQEAMGPVSFEAEDGNSVIRFVKRTINGNQVQVIPASLKLMETKKGWLIIEESDSVTDIRSANAGKIPEDAITGDFNGDGRKESVWLQVPKIKEAEMECDGDCTAYLKSNNPSFTSFAIENCIGSLPTNLGDLDGNGTDEIGLLHDWFTSCWKAYYVFTLKNNKWQRLIAPISTHCNQMDEGIAPVKKDPKRKGYLIVRYSAINDDGISTKTKSVKLK